LGEAAEIAVLILICLVGVVCTAVRLPGTWLIVAAAAGYGWLNGWERMTVTWVLILAGIAAVGEAIELLASVVTARRAGATKQAAWGGLVGAILGMFFLSVPLPILGTFIGAVLGCFAGAALTEVFIHNQLGKGARVGFFSAVGFAIGAATKVGLAVAMAGITIIVVAWPRAAGDAGPASQAGSLQVAPALEDAP
jgi:hypothetical protein